MEIIAEDLAFPEGPTLLPDGSLLVVEVFGGRLTHVSGDGAKRTVADLGGGPNGVAVGPDGAAYVCNNAGSIQRVDLVTGDFTELYTECGGHPLAGPNDIVFDGDGAFWFTCLGTFQGRTATLGGVYYASPDGSSIAEVQYPMFANGIGLSPDQRTLYVADTMSGTLWSWSIEVAGRLGDRRLVHVGYTKQLFDSLAVRSDGTIFQAALTPGGIWVVPRTGEARFLDIDGEDYVTNVCIAGEEIYATLSGTGRLARLPAP